MWFDKIREMKEKSGLSTKEIAEKSGIPEPTLEKLFAGTTKDPKLGTMRQLVHFFGHTLDDLEDRSNEKSPDTEGPVSGDKAKEIFKCILPALVSAGIIREGQDLSDGQADILIAVCEILRVAFEN